jgi:hypothetical protein
MNREINNLTDNNVLKIKKTNHPLIVSFEEFVDKTILSSLINEFRNQKIWNYNIDINFPEEIKNVLLSDETIQENSHIFTLVSNLCNVINNYFGETYCSVMPSVRRWEKGELQTPHMDNIEPDGRIPFTEKKDFYPYPIIDLTALIYLNDDYLGGEIYFPKRNIEIKPKAGSILVWPASENHGVKKILDGNRYTIVCFLIKARILAAFETYTLSTDWKNRILNSSIVENFLPY